MQPKAEPNGPLQPLDPIKQESLDTNLALEPLQQVLIGSGNSISHLDNITAGHGLSGASIPTQPIHDTHGGQPIHHNGHANQRPNFRTAGSFTGLAFHNPFDMNSYPITNPPILDSTVLPYGDLNGRHRRISISNGQIGQIVNHEAFFMDEDSFDDLNDLSPYPVPNVPPAAHDHRMMLYDMESGPKSSQLHHPQYTLVPAPPRGPVVTSAHHQQAPRNQFRPVQDNGPVSDLATPAPPVTQSEASGQSLDVAGVPPPNHQLLYNNEVIFNPNNGPIPGTAAWKKERLLERNRIAASKCRQRKKHAQQQLQDNMNKSQKKIKDQADRLVKYEKLFAIYNRALALHFGGKPDSSLDPLLQFLTTLIDDILMSSLDNFTAE